MTDNRICFTRFLYRKIVNKAIIINKEKATIESQLDVLRLKNQVEIKEKFGINVGGFGKGMKGQGQGKGMNR